MPAGFSESHLVAKPRPVDSRIWRGPQPDEYDIHWLANQGVTTIVDLRLLADRREAKIAAELGIEYVSIPVGYIGPSRSVVEQFLQIATDRRGGSVFVHCRHGRDRTGMMIGIYRMIVQNWSFKRTYAEMCTFGFRQWFFLLKQSVASARERFGRLDNKPGEYFCAQNKSGPATRILSV